VRLEHGYSQSSDQEFQDTVVTSGGRKRQCLPEPVNQHEEEQPATSNQQVICIMPLQFTEEILKL
jgi:hypothetical protein